MTLYTVLAARLEWHSSALNEAGKPYDLYRAVLEPQGTVKALTAEQALTTAKRLGHIAPLVEPAREPLQ